MIARVTNVATPGIRLAARHSLTRSVRLDSATATAARLAQAGALTAQTHIARFSAVGAMAAPKKPRSTLRRILLALPVVAIAGGAAYTWYDFGTYRALRFWYLSLPIWVNYRIVQVKAERGYITEEEEDELLNELHDKYAQKVLDIILELKGFYIKGGQVGSTRADFMAPQYLEKLECLQDDAPVAEDFPVIRDTIEAELGRPVDEVFAWIDEKPLGAASIGQVHRGVLLDGREVAIKVQYPGVEKCFRADIKTTKSFCALLQPEYLPMMNEIEKQFLTEFDYAKEALNVSEIEKNMAKSFPNNVKVPRPIHELCTRMVLVMDFLEGPKLVDGIKSQFAQMAARQGMTVKEMEADMRAKMASGEEIKAPTEEELDRYAKMIKTIDASKNAYIALYNWTLGWALGFQDYHQTPVPLNTPRIVKELLEVHAHQIFVDGAFNGDPHPGNILLLKDETLGLIDFGQVKRITLEERIELAKLIVALADGDEDIIADQWIAMGFRTKNMDRYVICKNAVVFFDRDTRDVTEGLNFHLFLEYLGKRDPTENMPDQYLMAGRVAMLFRGLGTLVGMKLSVADAWKGHAEALLIEHGINPDDYRSNKQSINE